MAAIGSLNIEVDFAVHDGKAAAVQGICDQMLAHGAPAEVLPANGLAFQPSLSPDGQQFSIRASAQAETAIQQLLLRIGPDLTQLDAHTRVTRLQCTGAASPVLRKALTRFNATFS